jgi:hypothetical protein
MGRIVRELKGWRLRRARWPHAASTVTLGLLMFVPAVASAQSAITGVAKDSSGAVLPGVTVEAASPALIEKVRAATTDGQGQYRIVDLRPGVYTVTFMLAGFNAFKREGIDLPAAFTATVNAQLTVGNLSETITVTGASPLVDASNVSQSTVMSKELLDAVPTASARMPQSYAFFVPGVAMPAGTQNNVGIGLGNATTVMTVNGASDAEFNIAIDGVVTRNMVTQGGLGHQYFINEGTVAEVVISTAAASAEQQGAGIVTNVIPKEGGNTLSGMFFYSYTDENFLSDNVTDALKALGVKSTNSTRKQWDVNPAAGGAIKRDTLWFYASFRDWGGDVASTVNYNLTPTGWVYTPDFNRPTASTKIADHSNSLRLTWQASMKNKFGFFFDRQPRDWNNRKNFNTPTSAEATTFSPYRPNFLAQVSWKSPISSRLLLEVVGSQQNVTQGLRWNDQDPLINAGPPGSQPDPNAIAAIDLDTNTRFRAAGHGDWYGIFAKSVSVRSRAALSYVTGTHSLKFGTELNTGSRTRDQFHNQDVSYSLRSGRPTQITLYAPFAGVEKVRPDMGLFAQDQWTIKRATLNLGIRYDYFSAYVPAQDVPANRWVAARHFNEVTDVMGWKDLSPRVGIAYDLFGNGKTALKGSLSRYVAVEGTATIGNINPISASISSATRNWTDGNFDYIPDCDFTVLTQNGECTTISNLLFGQGNPNATQFDPAALKGFGVRGYNWETSAGIQHELTRGLSVNASYFRRWYGNFQATDNLLVSPADYSAFCVPVPTDSRLPGGGGGNVCGFFDLNSNKLGQTLNKVTLESIASGGAVRSQIYNGFDVNLTGRLPGGAQFTVGSSTGRTATNNCLIVDSPELAFCDVRPPFQAQFKVFGVYPLPWWGVQVSGGLQSYPGPEIRATLVPTNAQVLPTLGRNLTAATRAVNLFSPGTQYLDDRLNRVDVRLTKVFKFGRARVRGSLDLLNALNDSSVTILNTAFGPDWLKPTDIQGARLYRLAAQIDF